MDQPALPQGNKRTKQTMQTIITKYLPATNTRGARIKATCNRGSCAIPYPHELDGDAAHNAAAQALVDRFITEDNIPGTFWARPRIVESIGVFGERVHIFLCPDTLVWAKSRPVETLADFLNRTP